MEYWIINNKQKTYCKVNNRIGLWDGDWESRYPHLRECDGYYSVVSVRDFDTVNGIPYVYDLCPSGGLFTLLADINQHTDDDIKQAERQLKLARDVVLLNVCRLRCVPSAMT